MAARLSIDERLRRIRALRDESDLAAVRAALSKGLADASNLIAGESAKLIAEMELSGFEPELIEAWERFLVDPLKTDKGCFAKGPIVETLCRLDYDDPDLYRAGLKYTQFEPAWGGREDTAVNVRSASAFALARSRQLRAVTKLMLFVDLLNSATWADRLHAAQAIADSGAESALPLLKLKLLSGDKHAEVLGACMAGMIRLDAAASIPLVVERLDSADEGVVIEAAAVLGECGQDAAVEALIERTSRTGDRELIPSLLGSLGLSRHPRATGYLIDRVRSNGHDALPALEALRPSLLYEEIRERVRKAVQETGNPALAKALGRV